MDKEEIKVYVMYLTLLVLILTLGILTNVC
jgi:hypothetical protein